MAHCRFIKPYSTKTTVTGLVINFKIGDKIEGIMENGNLRIKISNKESLDIPNEYLVPAGCVSCNS